jgi:hypothetical protein
VSELDPFVAANALNLWLLTRSTTPLLVRTLRAGPPPNLWSDSELAPQRLELAVEEALCGGERPGGELALEIPVVRGARSAAATPALADWLATPGARWILLREPDSTPDEDLGLLPATDPTIAWLRAACSGPPPPGPATILYLVADADGAFATMPATVVDLVDPLVRVTVSAGRMRVFSGLRAVRVVRTREPDARIRASAAALAHLVLERATPDVQVEGDDHGLLDALATAGRALAADTREAIARSVPG